MNFRNKVQPHRLLDRGSCTAIDRATMATCENFKPVPGDGGEGWCAWTMKPMTIVHPQTGKKTTVQSVSGECFFTSL